MKFFNLEKQNTKQKGSLLFEMLIVISLVAIILSVGTNAIFLSIRSSKASGERDAANTLASSALESVKAITEENWQNIYGLTKGNQHYYPSELEGKWVLVEGDETININDESYTRYLIIENVSRDAATRNIESGYVNDNDDPSTQKVTVTVSWSDGSPITVSEYFFRWRNKICNQTEWTTAEPGNSVKDCPAVTYDEKESSVDVTNGSLTLISVVAPTVAVGDTYQGGIVAYILQEGDPGYDANVQHGFIAAVNDQSSSVYWHSVNDGTVGTTSTAIGSGNANTVAIVGAYGAENNAAKLCSDLNLAEKTDWYLPSKDEIYKLRLNKALIGGFVDGWYWSSSEISYSHAWTQYFNGTPYQSTKADQTYIRCIRSF